MRKQKQKAKKTQRFQSSEYFPHSIRFQWTLFVSSFNSPHFNFLGQILPMIAILKCSFVQRTNPWKRLRHHFVQRQTNQIDETHLHLRQFILSFSVHRNNNNNYIYTYYKCQHFLSSFLFIFVRIINLNEPNTKDGRFFSFFKVPSPTSLR